MIRRLGAMAWRGLKRRPRRTAITILALGGGLALSTTAWVLGDGLLATSVDAMVGGSTGHLQVQAPGQLDEPNVYDVLPDTVRVLARLDADPRVVAAAPRVEGAMLLSSGTQSSGATLHGIDPAREELLSNPTHKLAVGRLASAAGEIALGRGLADRLDVGLDDEIFGVGQASDGSIAMASWQIVGLLDTGSGIDDRVQAWLDVDEAQEIFALDGAHTVVARLTDTDTASDVVRDLASVEGWTGVYADLGGAPAGQSTERWNRTPVDPEAAHVARTWRAINPAMASYYALSETWMLFSVGIVLVTAGMGAMNTLVMSVMERTRELGILMAVGLKPHHMVILIVLESLALASLSIAGGTLLGALLSAYLVYVGVDLSGGYGDIDFAGVSIEPAFRGEWSLHAFTWPISALILICLAASLLPAWRAARLDPVDAMGRR